MSLPDKKAAPPIDIPPLRRIRTIVITGSITVLLVASVYLGAGLRTTSQQNKALKLRQELASLPSHERDIALQSAAPQVVSPLESSVKQPRVQALDQAQAKRKRGEDRENRSAVRKKHLDSLKHQREIWRRDLQEIERKSEALKKRMASEAEMRVKEASERKDGQEDDEGG